MKRHIKVLLQLGYNLVRVNWLSLFGLYQSRSNKVILLSEFVNRRFSIEVFTWQVSSIRWMIKNNVGFRVGLSLSSIREGDIVLWAPNEYYGSGINYSIEVIEKAERLSEKTLLIPPVDDTKWLENKSFMYTEMKSRNISMPNTQIIHKNDIDLDHVIFPIIVKAEYSSGSRHVDMIRTKRELEVLLSGKYSEYEEIIIQEYLDIRKDLRVIYIDGIIESFYWRENMSDSWRPTATSKGNAVKFFGFPEMHRKSILDGFDKSGLRMAAADIAWNKDDLESEPIFLEISPRYSPNPSLPGIQFDYGVYKKRIAGERPFWRCQIDLIHQLNNKYLNSYKDEIRRV